jgi:hypothetical protein
MKSKSSTFILILVVLLVVAVLVYFFVIKGKGTPSSTNQTGLVSTNTGTAQGLQGGTATSETGSQVVVLLRNLTAIKLDDSVFRNPSFALLTDLSVSLPPVSNPGRRNPFAPIGLDAPVPPIN